VTELTVASYNIHKGFSALGRRFVLHEMRERLLTLNADIAFLQEVQGEHARHAKRVQQYVSEPQHEFLYQQAGMTTLYGRNASYDAGHHGNALVTRFDVLTHDNIDISHHRLESRGMLHAIVMIGGVRVHAICTHLGLLARSRRKQLGWMIEAIGECVGPAEPLIIAGDFNDWRLRASDQLHRELGLVEVFEASHGRPARTFPAAFPVIALDRIYVRGFDIVSTDALAGGAWSRLSDHAAIAARLRLQVARP
jgi:endonuclease/exonuclease/phosphatase family metal-dependent hydrolase